MAKVTPQLLWLMSDDVLAMNSSMWRVLIPVAAFKRAGIDSQVIHTSTAIERGPDWLERFLVQADLVVIERVFGEARWIIQLCQEGRLPVFGTFDDAYDLIPRTAEPTQAYLIWRRNKQRQACGHVVSLGRQVFKEWTEALGLLSAALVPTQALADRYGQYGRMVVVPNYPDLSLESWSQPKTPRPDVAPVIGWGGSLMHEVSWRKSGVLSGMATVLKRFPHAQLAIYGAKNVYTAITRRLPAQQVMYYGTLPFTEWPKAIRNFDLGLAPMYGAYDMHKSNIKLIEYAACGVPWVASDVPVYRQAAGGYLVQTPRAWREATLTILTEPRTRERLAQAGQAWAETLDIDRHLQEYSRVFYEYGLAAQGYGPDLLTGANGRRQSDLRVAEPA